MKPRVLGALVLLSAGVVGTLVSVHASDRIGIYAVVDKVVLEPSEAEPLRIQIWGAFAQAVTTNPNDYSDPQKGYLYYTCPAGKTATCRAEWSDIKSVAGKGSGVGFGGRFTGTGRIRKADEKPASPDPYPIDIGLMRMGSDTYHAQIAGRLSAALKQR
jgi:hypothetical protein